MKKLEQLEYKDLKKRLNVDYDFQYENKKIDPLTAKQILSLLEEGYIFYELNKQDENKVILILAR